MAIAHVCNNMFVYRVVLAHLFLFKKSQKASSIEVVYLWRIQSRRREPSGFLITWPIATLIRFGFPFFRFTSSSLAMHQPSILYRCFNVFTSYSNIGVLLLTSTIMSIIPPFFFVWCVFSLPLISSMFFPLFWRRAKTGFLYFIFVCFSLSLVFIIYRSQEILSLSTNLSCSFFVA